MFSAYPCGGLVCFPELFVNDLLGEYFDRKFLLSLVQLALKYFNFFLEILKFVVGGHKFRFDMSSVVLLLKKSWSST